jgi:hypothetical protein
VNKSFAPLCNGLKKALTLQQLVSNANGTVVCPFSKIELLKERQVNDDFFWRNNEEEALAQFFDSISPIFC